MAGITQIIDFDQTFAVALLVQCGPKMVKDPADRSGKTMKQDVHKGLKLGKWKLTFTGVGFSDFPGGECPTESFDVGLYSDTDPCAVLQQGSQIRLIRMRKGLFIDESDRRHEFYLADGVEARDVSSGNGSRSAAASQ